MNVSDISFPNLGIYLQNVSVNFSVFGFSVAFYGVMIASGFMAGGLLASRLGKSRGIKADYIWDVVLYGMVFGIIGARIYYVVFQFSYYKSHLLEIFNLRQGGLAIYGGLIAALLTLIIYSRKKKLSMLRLADSVAPGIMLGQVLGRFGNFFNRECFGEYYTGFFAMELPVAAVRESDLTQNLIEHMTVDQTILVHPTFLYEASWNLCFCVILRLIILKGKVAFDGQISLMYIAAYGLGRFMIEGLRTDSLMLGPVRVSQALALISFVAAASVMIWRLSRKADFRHAG